MENDDEKRPLEACEPQVEVIVIPAPSDRGSPASESGSNASTVILNGGNCDGLHAHGGGSNSDITKRTLSYSVMTNAESQQSGGGGGGGGRGQTVENGPSFKVKVNLVKGEEDDVDGPPWPGPRQDDESDGSTVSKLQNELRNAKKELQTKDEEISRLSRIRDDVEEELRDLTASLFVEAHKMVGDANEKRFSTEKSLTEATMKIDGLETEVSALKTLVLTSTPSRPNRHLHPHIDVRENGGSSRKLTFGRSAKSNKSPSGSVASLTSSLVVGAGGLNSSEPSNDSLPSLDVDAAAAAHGNLCALGADCDNSCGFYEERNIDPTFRSQFAAWIKSPTMDRSQSAFLERIYSEDIDFCLDFRSKSPRLRELVVDAIHNQSICITPLKADKNEFVKDCPLLNASNLLCKYHVRLDEAAQGEGGGDDDGGDDGAGKEFCISQLARNRITAVCNLLNYLDYIRKGLVKSRSNDIYWEILHLRKRIVAARMGFCPD